MDDVVAYDLQKWLEEVYFDSDKHADYIREQIVKFGRLVLRLMRYEPSTRITAAEALKDEWFQDETT